MPPKKAKDLANAPVLTMAHEAQVQLLSDALLREYMHRRGFLATLKAFDTEHPRDENTISSRALMSDLMALDANEQQRMKGEGVETIMEMLCNLRVERRLMTERLSAEAEMELPKVPANYDTLKAKQMEREARKAGKKGQQHEEQEQQQQQPQLKSALSSSASKKEKRSKRVLFAADVPRSSDDDSQDDDHDPHEEGVRGRGASGLQQQQRRHHHRHQHRNGNNGVKPEPQPRRNSKPTGARASAEAGMTIEDLLGSSRSGSDASDAEEAQQRRRSGSQGGASAEGPSPATSAAMPAWMEMTRTPVKGGAAGSGTPAEDGSDHTGSADDASDDSVGDVDVDQLGGAAASAELRDQLSAVFQLLCGFDGHLGSSFLEQGFTFDEGADCALVQWRAAGGCDGVLAPIQAFVAAYYYEREVYVAKPQRQRDCLAKALCTVLEQAQPSTAKIVLVDSTWRAERGATRYSRSQALRQAAKPRTRCWTGFASLHDVGAVLRDTLLTEDRWMQPRGSGVMSFLFSLLLSRGADALGQELAALRSTTADGARPTLLQPSTGRATLGLANLVLTGRAVFFRHNGVRNGSQIGYSTSLRCGLLCGDTHKDGDLDAAGSSGAPPSYTKATTPQFASWVVWHKGRYANLYMPKDTRQVFQQKLNLGGSASVELVYWDAATDEDEYVLTVTVRSITLGVGGGGSRNAASFVNTAITSVPAWSSAVVDWNGEAPLRD